MSTYVISDIHGNLRALQSLLVDVNFRYDGSDRLYLLGDYVDWGPDSEATIEYVMRLDSFPFVTCLMGNHDYMFLNEINNERTHSRERDNNWLFNNRGMETWMQYIQRPKEVQNMVYKWLKRRPFAAEVYANKKWYLLCHAREFLPEKRGTVDPDLLANKKEYAVWERIYSPNSNPLEHLYEMYPNHSWKTRKYAALICGHTISSRYMELADTEPLRIFKGKYFINIDCGGKCMGLDPAVMGFSDDSIMTCRLGMLRLEDGAEFYCDRRRAGYDEKRDLSDIEDDNINE